MSGLGFGAWMFWFKCCFFVSRCDSRPGSEWGIFLLSRYCSRGRGVCACARACALRTSMYTGVCLSVPWRTRRCFYVAFCVRALLLPLTLLVPVQGLGDLWGAEYCLYPALWPS